MTEIASDNTLPEELSAFLRTCLGEAWNAQPLHGDASVRRYFRVRTPAQSLILAYYPESVRESLRRFLDAHTALAATGRVPKILHSNDSGVLQEDVGDRTLFDLLHEDAARGEALYRHAIDLLIDFQQAGPAGSVINPPFDRQKFRDELVMTAEYYVEALMQQQRSDELLELFDEIATEMTTHPYVLCHRDYHGQNIHILNDHLFVIDFQDLRMGPDTYDLASLLRDRGAGARLRDGAEDELIAYYESRGSFAPGLRRRYAVNLLQRSIKAIGTFAKQAVTRDRRNYLAFIPPTLVAVEDAIRGAPEYDRIRALFPMTFPSGG